MRSVARSGERPARLVVRTLRGRFDMLDLRQALADQQSDILHVITHGRDDGLALWRDGEPIVASQMAGAY